MINGQKQVFQSYTIKVGAGQNYLQSNSVLTRKHELAIVDRRTHLFGLGWFRILSNHYHYKPTLIHYRHYYILKEAICFIKDVAGQDNKKEAIETYVKKLMRPSLERGPD